MDNAPLFDTEIARLRAEKVVGSGTPTGELFDFLASRGPDAQSASTGEIVREVFKHDIDEATVGVLIIRLRENLSEFYDSQPIYESSARIVIPPETRALRLQSIAEARIRPGSYRANRPSTLIAAGVALAVLALVALLA